MKSILNLKVIATSILLGATCSHAATIAYSWSSPTNLGTETGTLSTSIAGQGTGTGETVSLTAILAAPTITHNDGAPPSGFIGQQTSYTTAANNVTLGTHFGWSGAVNLIGSDSQGNSYSLLVDLTYEIGDSITASYTATDDNSNGDSVGLSQFALWPGDNSSGHRVSGASPTFAAGTDAFNISATRTFGATNTASAIGDNVGLLFGIRNEPATTSGTILFSNLAVSGNINQDDAGIMFTPVPEPSSTALLGLGGLALILRRRRA